MPIKNQVITYFENLANDALAEQIKKHDDYNLYPNDINGNNVVDILGSDEVNAWQHAYICGYFSSYGNAGNQALLAGYLKELLTPNQWSQDTLKDLYNNIKGQELAKGTSLNEFAEKLYKSQYDTTPGKVPSTKNPPLLVIDPSNDDRINGDTIPNNIKDLLTDIIIDMTVPKSFSEILKIFNEALNLFPLMIDPLLIDLDGDGIETTTVSRGTYFDHQSDGFAEASAWVGEDDGILAFDKNNNGFIDNGNEIFGDNYIKSDGTKATSGFDALSDFDSNNDGVINALDEKFSQLKILKGDDSLITLEQAGIVSINLNSYASNQVDENGNTQLSSGTYTKSDGTTGQIGDYYLQNDKKDSFATEWVEVPEDVLQLPDIKGQGTVYSLHQAIARDTSGELKELVEDFINSTNKNDKIILINEILYKWTGANQIEPDSRGSNIDAQQLYVLEKFMGENFIGVDGTGNPNNQACNLLNNAYAMLKNIIYAQLQSKTELKPLYDLLDLQYNSSTHKYGYNIDAIQQYIDDKININSTSGKELLTDFCTNIYCNGT